jgi:hypothetical protein
LAGQPILNVGNYIPDYSESLFRKAQFLQEHSSVSVTVVTPLWTERQSSQGSIPDKATGVFSSPQLRNRLWGPHRLLSNAYRGSLFEGKAAGA